MRPRLLANAHFCLYVTTTGIVATAWQAGYTTPERLTSIHASQRQTNRKAGPYRLATPSP
jgi:hypothetical protein